MRDMQAEARDLYLKNRSERSGAIRRELLHLADSALALRDSDPSAVANHALTLASIWIRELRTKLERIEREIAK